MAIPSQVPSVSTHWYCCAALQLLCTERCICRQSHLLCAKTRPAAMRCFDVMSLQSFQYALPLLRRDRSMISSWQRYRDIMRTSRLRSRGYSSSYWQQERPGRMGVHGYERKCSESKPHRVKVMGEVGLLEGGSGCSELKHLCFWRRNPVDSASLLPTTPRVPGFLSALGFERKEITW